jgi:2',3'-cyclic-nucleotide 2'-phosphodiesterase (5'-nucleotidase family)
MSTPDHVAGLEFSQEIDAATQAVQKLRASGADLVIGITHVGYKHDREIALAVPGIDVIIGGHSHTGLTVPYEDPLHHTIICQTYGHLTTVGRLELDLDMETRSIAAYQGELQELFTEAVPMDRKVNDEVQALVRKSEKGFDVVIGQSRSQLTRAGMEESSLGNLITDAMREEHHGDVAFHNSGGMRADLPKGDVLYRDVYEIDAYGNSVVTLDLTGAQVWKACEVSINGHHAIFQVSGIRMTYDKSKPIGQRILEITVNGEPLDSARVYHVVTNSFLGAGGGEYEVFGQGENFEDSGVMLRDVLANYIRRHSPVEAKVEGRIVELSGR